MLRFQFNDQSIGFNSMDPPFGFTNATNSSANSFFTMDKDQGNSTSPPDHSHDFTDTVLDYISQVLMEDKPCMFHDALALQAAHKYLYEVTGQDYPPIPIDQNPTQAALYGSYQAAHYPNSCSPTTFNLQNSYITSTSIAPPWNGDFLANNTSTPSLPSNFVFQSTSDCSLPSLLSSQNNISNNLNGLLGSSVSEFVVPNCLSTSEWALQFNKGVEEARKFLPKFNQLTIDVEDIASSAPELREKASKMVVRAVQMQRENSPTHLTGKKNRAREDEDSEEERSNKQSAVSVDENELLELLDKVSLCGCKKEHRPTCILNHPLQDEYKKTLLQKEQTNGPTAGGKPCGKKQGNKKGVVDLRTLLIYCAKAISSNDLRAADEQLMQIRQHSSQFGDCYQRLAHFFGDALEARIAGTGTQVYTELSSKRKSVADILNTYQLYLSACPFQKYAIIFANRSILGLVKEKKAKILHVIDFGILYGFQWPVLIMRLSRIQGGPPRLRITGIDYPQQGFRPSAGVQETGRRLANYCERFNVPFEYNAIARKWETIKIEDLKMRPDEVVVVHSLNRFKNLLDETAAMNKNNPRDAVLNLIRKTNPDMFVHSVVSGNHNAPFFMTRFREVLFDYSALFDMSDTIIPREDQVRLMLEKGQWGRQVMNAVACEGTKRIERAETYKQWQSRTMRAGFRQRPLSSELMEQLKLRVKQEYHNDFSVEQDGQWMLQGWKGRILFASSVWLPA